MRIREDDAELLIALRQLADIKGHFQTVKEIEDLYHRVVFAYHNAIINREV